MARREPILLIGLGDGHDVLAGRIVLFGMRALRARDFADAARVATSGPERPRAALAPLGLESLTRAEGVRALREAGDPLLRLVATGTDPGPDGRAKLRADGFEFCLWEPFTDAALRFVVNQALRDRTAGERRDDERAPTDLMGHVRGGTGEKPVLIYNISTTGAFLETHRPNPKGARLVLTLPLGEHKVDVNVLVVHANVKGNLQRQNLPTGMAVMFVDPPPDIATRIARYVAEQTGAFDL